MQISSQAQYSEFRVMLTGLFFVLFAAGCGGGSKSIPQFSVKGKVTFGGKPVAGGTIMFRDDKLGHGGGAPLEKGQFSLKLPAGDYIVSVRPPVEIQTSPEGDSAPAEVEIDAADIPAEYRVEATSDLRAIVEPSNNKPFEFELKK